jgi:hypothetical protein
LDRLHEQSLPGTHDEGEEDGEERVVPFAGPAYSRTLPRELNWAVACGTAGDSDEAPGGKPDASQRAVSIIAPAA